MAAAGDSVRDGASCAVPPCGRGFSRDAADPSAGTAQLTRLWHIEQSSSFVSFSFFNFCASSVRNSFCDLNMEHSCVSKSFLSFNALTMSSNSSNLAFFRSREVCAATLFFSFFLWSFSSHVKWSRRRFFPRRQTSGLNNEMSDISSICCGTLLLSASIDVVKFNFDADLSNSLVGIVPEAFARPLGKVTMTLFSALMFCHKISVYRVNFIGMFICILFSFMTTL